MNTILELLMRARAVSDSHFKHSGKWSVWNQIGHAHSEISEVYSALRRSHASGADIAFDKKLREHVVDEIWDCIYSALTIAHVLDISQEEVVEGCEKTMRKIEQRVGIEVA